MFISSVLTGYLQITLAHHLLAMSGYEVVVPYFELVKNRWMEYAKDADDVLPTT